MILRAIPPLVRDRVKMIRERIKIGSKTKLLRQPKFCLPLLLPPPLIRSCIRFLVTTYLDFAEDFSVFYHQRYENYLNSICKSWYKEYIQTKKIEKWIENALKQAIL